MSDKVSDYKVPLFTSDFCVNQEMNSYLHFRRAVAWFRHSITPFEKSKQILVGNRFIWKFTCKIINKNKKARQDKNAYAYIVYSIFISAHNVV